MKVNITEYGENRKIEVEIHDFDTWNADATLAHIIHPLLLKFAEPLQSYPNDFDNVNEWGEVVQKMIWSFGQIVNDEADEPDITKDKAAYMAYHDRIQEGLNLFGQYYRNLWN